MPTDRSVLMPRARLGLLVALAALLGYRVLAGVLSSDLRFTLGALRLGRQAGFDATEVWMHRPLAYRVLMDPLSRLRTAHLVLDERLIVAALLIGALGACAVAGWGLAKRVPDVAWAFAAGCAVALCWSGTWFLAEPEWVAMLLALAGGGVALGTDAPGRRRWLGMLGAAVLFSLAALQKYTSVSVALCVLIALATLSLRRAIAVGLACVPVGAALFGATLLLGSHEWQWFREMGLLNVPRRDAAHMLGTLVSLVVGWPIVALVPLALVLTPRAHRLRALGAAVAVLVVTFGFALAQGTWFLYHWTAPVTLAAGWLATRLHSLQGAPRTSRRPAYAGLVLVTLTSAALLYPSADWRVHHESLAVALMAGEVVLICVLVVLGSRGPSAPAIAGARSTVVAAAGVLVSFLVCLLPWTPYSYSMSGQGQTVLSDLRLRTAYTDAPEVKRRLGAANVVMLTTGEPGYLLDLPITCRYPSPTYLQRAYRVPEVLSTRGFTENLACLDDERVRWAVVQQGWFKRRPPVSTRLDTNFDCRAPEAFTYRGLRFCPRRPTG